MQLEYNIYFELTAACFVFFLAVYERLQYNMKVERNRLFFQLTLLVLCAEVLDIVTAITISYSGLIPNTVNMLLNTAYFASNAMLGNVFIRYASYLGRGNEGRPVNRILGWGLLFLYYIVLVVNLFTGWVFSFDAAHAYQHGPIYMIGYVVPYIYFWFSAVLMFKSLKGRTIRQKVSIILFILVSFSGAIIQIFVIPDVLFNLFTLSLGIIIILFSLETPEYEKLLATMKELEIAKAKAQSANEAKSRFLANMSHEIRTPINAVLGMDEMILRESDSAQVREYAQSIRTASNTLLSIINDILDFSKIESGRMEILPVEYEVADLIEESRQMIIQRVLDKGLRLECICESTIPRRLCGDVLRVQQIVMNLLTNAVKYTREGTITFRLKWEPLNNGEMVLVISVEDTGVGISEENQKKLFQSFERLDERQVRGIEGTGLGLAITRQLVEQMNGEIGLYSTPGRGSLFYVRIPQQIVSSEPVGDWEKRTAESAMSLQREREQENEQKVLCAPRAQLLVVDDVEMNLKVVCNLLRRTQVQIDTALSGAEALDKAKEKRYDVIFLDDMMPQMDGQETLQHLREDANGINAEVPVVMLTANVISRAREAYLGAGFSDYVSKPATGAQLEMVLRRHLPKDLIEE